MKLLLALAFYAFATFIVSLLALIFTLKFVNTTQTIYLEDAPKATLNLHKVYLPPMKDMQIFVFVFDMLVGLYYFFQMPLFDFIRNHFVFLKYETKGNEDADCSSFLLSMLL